MIIRMLCLPLLRRGFAFIPRFCWFLRAPFALQTLLSVRAIRFEGTLRFAGTFSRSRRRFARAIRLARTNVTIRLARCGAGTLLYSVYPIVPLLPNR